MMSTTVRAPHRLATLFRKRIAVAGGPSYLLRDEFNTDAAAPLAGPRACEPGPGTLTLVQNDGQFSISGGKLVFPAQATPAWGDLYLVGPALTRTTGRVLSGTANWSTQAHSWLGWNNDATPGDSSFGVNVGGITFRISPNIDTSYASGVGTASSGVDYQIALVMRGTGGFVLVKGGAFTNWTLLWVETIGSADMYPSFSNYQGVGTLDSFRVTDLPAPWNTDYGIATTRLAGTVAAGTTFTHAADCLIEWTVTTVGNYDDVRFRIQDANNYWYIETSASGAISLNEVVNGVDTNRAQALGVISSGHRVVLIADGQVIRAYSNNVLRFTYSSATNFQTATSGKRLAPFGGGVISDVVAWPRHPTFPSV